MSFLLGEPVYLTNGIRLFFNECPFYLTNGPILSLKECPFYLITGEGKRQNVKWRIHTFNLPTSFPSTEQRHDNPAHPSRPPSPSPLLSEKPHPPLVYPTPYSSKSPFWSKKPFPQVQILHAKESSSPLRIITHIILIDPSVRFCYHTLRRPRTKGFPP